MRKVKDLTLTLAGTIVRVALVILAAIYIMKFAGTAYDFGFRLFAEEPMSPAPGRDITLTVANETQKEIIQMLEDKGLIRDHLLFTIQKKLSLYKGDIKPGTYTLNTSMTTDEMLEILVGEVSDDDENAEGGTEELTEELDPATDDLTGLDTGGVLSEEGEYDEGAAFVDEGSSEDGTVGEFEGEGDEESAIEE